MTTIWKIKRLKFLERSMNKYSKVKLDNFLLSRQFMKLVRSLPENYKSFDRDLFPSLGKENYIQQSRN